MASMEVVFNSTYILQNVAKSTGCFTGQRHMAISSQMSNWQSKMVPFEEHSSTSGHMQVSQVSNQLSGI